ncbi:MAG: hypothetical protein WC607_02275 [Candidatus Micrarchaeia archaeon]
MVFLELATLLVGVAFLSKSAELVVEHAERLARFLGIGQLAVGFLLVSTLTTLPELSVSVISSSAGEGAIAAGNAFGSIVCNILLILGLGGVLYGFKVNRADARDAGLTLLVTTVLALYMLFSSAVRGEAIGFGEGVLLLLVFVLYALVILRREPAASSKETVSREEAVRSFLFFAGGIFVVLFSASVVVGAAVALAASAGIAESFIGATIIALGTSLPELSIVLSAFKAKRYGLGLGNVIGANMLNATLVLGAAAIISPLSVLALPVFTSVLLFAVLASVALLYAVAVGGRVGRRGGAAFLALYVIYLVATFALQFAPAA